MADISDLGSFQVDTDCEQAVLVHYNDACDWTVSACMSLAELMRIAERHAAECDGKPQPPPPPRTHPVDPHISRLWAGEVKRALAVAGPGR